MADVSIRPSRHDDVPALIDLVKGSWARTYDPLVGADVRSAVSSSKHVPALFEGEIDSADGISFVAVDEGETLVGQVGGTLRADGVFFVDHLHVVPGHKGTGLATRLLDAAVASVADRAAEIELTVLIGNDRAIGFYRKYGFVDHRQIAPEDGMGGLPELVMRAPLSGASQA